MPALADFFARRSRYRLLLTAFVLAGVAGLGAALMTQGTRPATTAAATPALQNVVPAPAPVELVPEAVPSLAIESPEFAVTEAAGVEDATPAIVEPIEAQQPTAPGVIEGEIARGESLAGSLGKRGVTPLAVDLIASKMIGYFDFRQAQPGHQYRLTQDAEGRVESFSYRINPLLAYRLSRDADERYVVERDEAKLETRTVHLAGVVTSSLYGAILELGENAQLASDFTDIFAWSIDFSRTAQSGDEFSILYERLYRVDDAGNEVYERPGRILAARFGGAAGGHTAIYFERKEGRGGYYRPDGSSMEGRFLVAPLSYSRISSRFTNARRHPILKTTRPHHGIDYAAPRGTPIWSVSDGEVVYKGWGGGFGRLVKVKHQDGYVSYYAHLQKYASGLRVGQQVSQKQVIGYVGSSGLATGPHVCFRIKHNGRFVNPARVRTPEAEPIGPKGKDEFLAARDGLLAALDTGSHIATGL